HFRRTVRQLVHARFLLFLPTILSYLVDLAVLVLRSAAVGGGNAAAGFKGASTSSMASSTVSVVGIAAGRVISTSTTAISRSTSSGGTVLYFGLTALDSGMETLRAFFVALSISDTDDLRFFGACS